MARRHRRTVSPEPSVLEHRVLTVEFPEPDQARVRECLVDDLRLIQDIQPGAGLPDGSVMLVDDDIATSEVSTTLVEDEAGWRITMREHTEKLEGVRDCAIFSP